MKIKKLVTMTLVTVICSLAFTKVNATVLTHDSIKSAQSCFSDNKSYEDFVEQSTVELLEARGKKPAGLIRIRMEKMLKSKFSKKRYQHIKSNVACTRFIYEVDGNDVIGFYLAKNAMPLEKNPLVIFNRGGNGNFGKLTLFGFLSSQLPLVEKGHIVLASNYRAKDEFGGKDLEDVTSLVKIGRTLPNVDSDRVGMFGVSRGGHMTYMAARELGNIKSIAVWAGISDQALGLKQRPEMEKVFRYRVPNYEMNKTNELNKRSVIQWLDKLPNEMPILLLHGDADKRVHVDQSLILAKTLKAKNHPHELKIYEGGDHGLRPHRKAAITDVVQWFSRTL